MQYTKQEIVTVATAMHDLGVYLNLAHDSLQVFWERYFENIDRESRAAFALEAERCPDFIGNQVFAIMHLLCEAKKELEVFTDPDSSIVRAFLADAKEKQAIIEVQKED